MQPLTSVIVPVFNRAHLVEAAIRSIQAQTVKDLEIIVVDDGSKDDIGSVMECLTSEDSSVRFFRQAVNRGAQAARNRGIQEARGEWIAFLDSDDQWLPKGLELRLAAARKENAEVVHSWAQIIESDGERRLYEVPPLSGWIYKKLLQGDGPLFPSLLVKRKALEKIGGLDGRIVAYQEWDTSIRLSKHFRFAFVAEPTFVYDCRGADTISKQFGRNGAGYEQILRKHGFEMFRHTGAWTLVSHYETAARWYDKAGDVEAARRCRVIARRWKLLHPQTVLEKFSHIFRPNE